MRVYRRSAYDVFLKRVHERRRFIQVLAGPRQVGKTTLALQVREGAGLPSHYATADDPVGRDPAWIEAQWSLGRLRAAEGGRSGGLLILDEVQKVPEWSEAVKRLWDEDSAGRVPLRVMILGSAPLLVARGLSESLAGRFELVRVTHWSFGEMREAFGWGLNRFLYFGGYPGAAALAEDEERWRRYILDSLVETTLARDVLLLNRVDKPALLRQLFRLACDYSGQILSFNKMVGSLQDAGNTTTLAHYLDLLSGAGMVVGLQKYSGSAARRRGSSPKLVVLNTALMNAVSGRSLREATEDHEYWGHVVESAVGGHLVNAGGAASEVLYWRERDLEVDFVVVDGRNLVAVEVTTAGRKGSMAGMGAFAKRFVPRRQLLVGGQGIPVDEFLARPATDWLR